MLMLRHFKEFLLNRKLKRKRKEKKRKATHGIVDNDDDNKRLVIKLIKIKIKNKADFGLHLLEVSEILPFRQVFA